MSHFPGILQCDGIEVKKILKKRHKQVVGNVLKMETDASSSTLRGSKGHEGRAADPHSEKHGSGFNPQTLCVWEVKHK